jgi:small subunit ribosomal protein S6
LRLYEGLFLFDSNLAGRDWPGLEKHVEDVLKKNSAELVYSERWPDRKLAYEIKGCRKGTYYLTYFHAPTASIRLIERDIQLSERILRAHILQNRYLDELLAKRRELAESGALAVPAPFEDGVSAGGVGSDFEPVGRRRRAEDAAEEFVPEVADEVPEAEASEEQSA